MNRIVLRYLLLITILAVNISCDRVSKTIVRNSITENEMIPVIENFVTLTNVENTGAFLSAGSNLPKTIKFILLTLLPIAALSAGLFIMFRKSDYSLAMRIGIGFLVGGGIGNIYDRLLFGSVTDFMHIDFQLFQTGIFNFADVSVMMGMIIIFTESYRKRYSMN